jgi:hypothetical protein
MPIEPRPAPPPIGNLRLYSNSLPALQADRYDIVVRQEVEFTNGNPTRPEFAHHQQFLVQGARFSLEATALHSVYPPGGSLGEYRDALPNIVLTKPALPWERSLDEHDPARDVPWMALLLFDPEELIVAAENASPTRSAVYPIQEILNPNDQAVFRPQLALNPIEQAQTDLKAIAIDITPDTFRKIVPAYGELPYLAHVRQVNPEDKEFRAATRDGWFAVVVGNRLIRAGEAKTPQIAHLVSLEGFREYLPKADGSQAKNFDGYRRVRLVSLAGWAFTSEPQRGDFGVLMKNMSCDRLRFPTGAEPCSPPGQGQDPVDTSSDRKPPAPADSTPFSPQQLVRDAFGQGYVALNYGPTRLGEATVAWYRGPFVPIILARANLPAFLNAESAMIYDDRTGLFDLSYAVAWQIGRLLALSDRQFGVNLLQWRRLHHRTLDRLQSRVNLYKRYRRILHFPKDVDQMLEGHIARALFFNFLQHDLSPRIAPRKRGVGALFTSGDPSGMLKALPDLPGVLAPREIEAILQGQEDLHRQLRNKVFR